MMAQQQSRGMRSGMPRKGDNRAARAGMLALALALVAGGPADAQTAREATLEKRVQELERTLGSVLDEVRALRQTVGELRGAAANAKPTKVVGSGKEGVSLELSGQVNRGVLIADDGRDLSVFHVDNDHSSTRIRLLGTGQFDDEFGVGTVMEVQFEANSSAAVNQLADRGIGPDNFTKRKLELYLDSKTAGRIWLGFGDTASNEIAELDLSGTTVIAKSDIDPFAGGLLFAQKNIPPGSGITAVSLASPTIASAFNNMDGLSRDDRVRYDTPKFMGFQASGSLVADGRKDAALRYSGALGPVKAAAGIGFANIPNAQNGGFTSQMNQLSGSISLLHDSGLSATFAAGTQFILSDPTGLHQNPGFWYAKLGYSFNPFSFGATALAIDYTEQADIAANGDFSRAYGVYAVQNIDRVATELYVGLRNHELDRHGANFEDILAVLTGARVKF